MPVSMAGRGRASVGRWAPGELTGHPTGPGSPVGWGSRPARRGAKGSWWPWRDGTLARCAVDQNVPDHPRCTMFANCAAADRQPAQVAARRAIGPLELCHPPVAQGPSLWPSTLERSFPLGCALAAQAQSGPVTLAARSGPGRVDAALASPSLRACSPFISGVGTWEAQDPASSRPIAAPLERCAALQRGQPGPVELRNSRSERTGPNPRQTHHTSYGDDRSPTAQQAAQSPPL